MHNGLALSPAFSVRYGAHPLNACTHPALESVVDSEFTLLSFSLAAAERKPLAAPEPAQHAEHDMELNLRPRAVVRSESAAMLSSSSSSDSDSDAIHTSIKSKPAHGRRPSPRSIKRLSFYSDDDEPAPAEATASSKQLWSHYGKKPPTAARGLDGTPRRIARSAPTEPQLEDIDTSKSKWGKSSLRRK